MAEEKPPLSLRLDKDYRRRLEKLGQSYNGLSEGQMARRIVQDYLDDAEREKIKERLGGVEESLEVLRVGLVNSVEMLLVQTGMTATEAEEYINDTFRRR